MSHSSAAEWPLRPAEPLAESGCRVEEARRERGEVELSGLVPSGPFRVKPNGEKNSETRKVGVTSLGDLESVAAGTAAPVRLSTGMTWRPSERLTRSPGQKKTPTAGWGFRLVRLRADRSTWRIRNGGRQKAYLRPRPPIMPPYPEPMEFSRFLLESLTSRL